MNQHLSDNGAAPYPSSLYLNSEVDDLFENGPWPKPFEFNEEVVRVFDDMVSRSVPLYREVIACAANWTRAYYQPGTRIVDVGCSTGTFLELIGRFLPQPATLVGIDNSEAMLEKAKEKLSVLGESHRIELLCRSAVMPQTLNSPQTLTSLEAGSPTPQRAPESVYANSSVIVMNYTLQFLPLEERRQLIDEIYAGLVPGGLLFVSEKVRSSTPQFQETITHQYEGFKERNGYARTEIERKKEALEHVLVPLTYEQQSDMLRNAGFAQVDTLIKLHNFTTFVARKTESA